MCRWSECPVVQSLFVFGSGGGRPNEALECRGREASGGFCSSGLHSHAASCDLEHRTGCRGRCVPVSRYIGRRIKGHATHLAWSLLQSQTFHLQTSSTCLSSDSSPHSSGATSDSNPPHTTSFRTDPCMSLLQLVDNLTTASKVVEVVEMRAHCPLQDCFPCYDLGVYSERCSVFVRPRRSVERRVWPPRGGVIGVIWPCSWPHGGLCVDAISIKGMSFSSVFIYVPPTCSAKPDTSAVKLESGPKYRFL